ncbi:hypothetical protein [Sphingobacterium spiritivorum]|uniref:hypothetical protein n=1 Tax=Sphingobacterium spiritivorum TaxID=258 RepID=UPI001F3A100F|nr:hypothetical protein [Sphingobacterium spiritivorum]
MIRNEIINMNTHPHKDPAKVKIAFEPQIIEADKPAFFVLSITEDGINVPLEVVHTMKMHLLVVNEELTWFDHIHPEKQADGTYYVAETFPSAGKYIFFIDYKPVGLPASVSMKLVGVQGRRLHQVVEQKPKLVTTVEGYTITLLNGEKFKTNTAMSLQFSIEKEGRMLTEKDMEPYLGANAHIVMISQIDKDFLHIHPMSDDRFPIYAKTDIKKSGLYRMWVQFKIEGKVHTADFTVLSSEGDEGVDSNNSHSAHH